MRRVLDQVDEIQRIQALDPPGGTELHRFRYEGGGFWGYLSAGVQADGKILLTSA
jgi:hypothetical protein